jgi:hypothetical protein
VVVKQIVPLIGSDIPSLSGIVHLPRLWEKALLKSVGVLPAGYHSGSGPFDELLAKQFGLDLNAFVAFLQTRPTYLATEEWVREHGRGVNAANIAEWKRAVIERLRNAEKAGESNREVGTTGLTHTVILNSLDDWKGVHEYALAHRGETIVPAISSQSVGPAGIKHLPRLWLKALLKAVGSLPAGWRSGPDGSPGMDPGTYDDFSLAPEVGIAYIEQHLPNYVQYEAWFREHAKVDIATIDAHNARVFRDKPDERGAPERAELGITDSSVRLNTVLNDLTDWKAVHDQVVGLAAATA